MFWKTWRSKFEKSSSCRQVDSSVHDSVIAEKFAEYFFAVTFVMMLSKLLRFILSIYLNDLITGASLYPTITLLIRSWLVES